MHAAAGKRAARQRHVDRFGGKLLLHRHFSERLAARLERGLDLALGAVDGLTAGALFLNRQLAQALHERRERTILAEVTGLGVFQSRRLLGGGEVSLGRLHDLN